MIGDICTECGEDVPAWRDVQKHAERHQVGTDGIVAKPAPKARTRKRPATVEEPATTSRKRPITPARKGGDGTTAPKVRARRQEPSAPAASEPKDIVNGGEAPVLGPTIAKSKRSKAKPVAEPEPLYPTREAWMLAAVDAMRPWYVEAGLPAVPPVSISIGWAGGRGSKKGVRGQCWASHTTSNKQPAIFVTPDNTDPLTILGIILHEMNHASDDGISGHKGAFAKNAATLGFEKPWTSSEGKNEALHERLTALLAELGTFPHGSITDRAHGLTGLNPLAPPVQTTRMLKVQCLTCGCILRMTQKWINEAGLPTCGCGSDMIQDPAELLAGLGL